MYRIFGMLIAFAFLATATAQAGEWDHVIPAPNIVPVPMYAPADASYALPLEATGKSPIPIGHYEYCKQYSSDCLAVTDTGPRPLTRHRWKQLQEVNNRVNNAVRPMSDKEQYGVEELWAYPKHLGDCEDFVLDKRWLLIKRGWSPSDLLITLVYQPDVDVDKDGKDDGHAVLSVRIRNPDGKVGYYVLDSIKRTVGSWHVSGYGFIKRQNPRHSGQWEYVDHIGYDHTASL